MAYGMTYDQYWYGDPWMVRAYAQAYLLKRKIENEQAWIEGAYFYNAMSAVMTTAFSKSRKEYVKKPLEFYPKTEAEKEEEKRQKRRELVEFLDNFRVKAKSKTGSDSDGC